MRDFIRAATPNFLLDLFRSYKKKKVRSQLNMDKKKGKSWSKEQLKSQLQGMGIAPNDVLLVHSSLSKMGYVNGGAHTVVDAILDVIGENGHLLMPNSPNASFQADYITKLKVFDVVQQASKLGAISEVHRTHPKSVRSWHPTEPVSCIGPNAHDFVAYHHLDLTPYGENSPFYKVAAAKGKILMIGVTLANAGTNLHVLEDAVQNFKYPIYLDEVFEVEILTPSNEKVTMKTKVHNPEWSKKRKCDELIPLFQVERALTIEQLGNAKCLLLDAHKMLEVMIRLYEKQGVTMYTPQGS
ncbi:MAG: AAC(3) family N-acetyltransferase [Crocinitomicaceae bacterium]|nr:AAC(3) family N-acetyltransferase [Crocinitomicaceae bacterium]